MSLEEGHIFKAGIRKINILTYNIFILLQCKSVKRKVISHLLVEFFVFYDSFKRFNNIPNTYIG